MEKSHLLCQLLKDDVIPLLPSDNGTKRLNDDPVLLAVRYHMLHLTEGMQLWRPS